jgi:hypothetical protein
MNGQIESKAKVGLILIIFLKNIDNRKEENKKVDYSYLYLKEKNHFEENFLNKIGKNNYGGKRERSGRRKLNYSLLKNDYNKNKRFIELKGAINKFGGNEIEGERLFNDYYKKINQNSNENINTIITNNAINLIKDLPTKSPFRKPLLSKLTKNISNKNSSKLFNISKSIISTSQKLENSKNILFTMKYLPYVERKKVTQNHINHIINIWNKYSKESATRTICINRKSKKYIPVRWIALEKKSIYNKYLESELPNNIQNHISIGTFIALKPKNVKILQKKEALCIHCKIGYQYIDKFKIIIQQIHKNCFGCNKNEKCPQYQKYIKIEGNFEKLQNIQDEIEIFENHKKIYQHQDLQYNLDIKNLKKNEIIIIQDFSAKFFLSYSFQETQQEWFLKDTINDLVLTLITKKNNELKKEYLNFFNNTQESDFIYVKNVWEYLINDENINLNSFSKIKVWSDGGPKHFKTRRTMNYFSKILNQKIIYNFFCSCHGKGNFIILILIGPCDGHIGVCKRKIKNKSKSVDIKGIEEIKEIILQCENTSVIILNEMKNIDKDDCTSLNDISLFHQFKFKNNSELICYQLSNIENNSKNITLLNIPENIDFKNVKAVSIVNNITGEIKYELKYKKQNKCKYCQKLGHNKRTCPQYPKSKNYKKDLLEIDIEPDEKEFSFEIDNIEPDEEEFSFEIDNIEPDEKKFSFEIDNIDPDEKEFSIEIDDVKPNEIKENINNIEFDKDNINNIESNKNINYKIVENDNLIDSCGSELWNPNYIFYNGDIEFSEKFKENNSIIKCNNPLKANNQYINNGILPNDEDGDEYLF